MHHRNETTVGTDESRPLPDVSPLRISHQESVDHVHNGCPAERSGDAGKRSRRDRPPRQRRGDRRRARSRLPRQLRCAPSPAGYLLAKPAAVHRDANGWSPPDWAPPDTDHRLLTLMTPSRMSQTGRPAARRSALQRLQHRAVRARYDDPCRRLQTGHGCLTGPLAGRTMRVQWTV